jgi:hypothetical protein
MDSHQQRPPDPDLVERYVLGRLTERERAEVEHLLAEEVRWREAVEREQQLVAGIRRLGRDRLKGRLRLALREAPARAIPWPRVIAAAASVLIILGIVVVNQWTRMHEDTGTGIDRTLSDIPRRQTPSSPTIPPRSESPAARDKEHEPPRESEGSVPSATKGTQEQSGRARQAAAKATFAEHEAAATASPALALEGTGTWTQAHLYRPLPENGASAKQLLSMEESRRARNVLGDEDISASRIGKASSNDTALVVTVNQRLFDSLAPETQAHFQGSAPGQMLALVEQQRDTLRVTLYPSAPFDPAELERATVEVADDDSLLITVARQQIGLRLPPGRKVQASPPSRP